MKLSELRPAEGSNPKKFRKGRGHSSGNDCDDNPTIFLLHIYNLLIYTVINLLKKVYSKTAQMSIVVQMRQFTQQVPP